MVWQCLSSDENRVPVPHLWESRVIEVFQPKLVIFRAEPSIDASIRTCVPSKRALNTKKYLGQPALNTKKYVGQPALITIKYPGQAALMSKK